MFLTRTFKNSIMKANIGTAFTDDDLRYNYRKSDIKKSFTKECYNIVVDILIGLQYCTQCFCNFSSQYG